MRRIVHLIATVALAALVMAPPPARAQGGQPPQAWLFGAWTGGLFPPPDLADPNLPRSPSWRVRRASNWGHYTISALSVRHLKRTKNADDPEAKSHHETATSSPSLAAS